MQPFTVYSFRQTIECIRRNFWVYVQAVLLGYVGLDPEQAGSRYVWTRRDDFTLGVLGVFFLLGYWSGFWGVLIFLLSPVVCTWFIELGNFEYPGPRVWLPRWYLAVFGIVLMWRGAAEWLKWGIVIVWALQSYYAAGFYGNELEFYKQVKRENPQRDRYRAVNLAICYLKNDFQSQAEDEYLELEKVDGQNPKIAGAIGLMRMNVAWLDKGYTPIGFRCGKCGIEDSRLLKVGDRLSGVEHAMLFGRICPQCGQQSVPWEREI